MMDELIRQLDLLNRTMQRLADAFSPSVDAVVLDRFHAFKCATRNGLPVIKGIPEPDPITFDDILGTDDLIRELRDNTEQLLEGLPCNNALLYGPRGTGKSSAVKALLNAYAAEGLRMIEVPRDSLIHILELADIVRERKEKFIIFCDDLTFDDDERSYRSVKTVLEGGLEVRPSNMLVYATSNRRHMLPETVGDNQRSPQAELHPEEAMEEKISLSDRFGLRLGFQYFDFETYFSIVRHYAAGRRLRIGKDELRRLAMQWSIGQGSFSGRAARQFADSLEGRLRRVKR